MQLDPLTILTLATLTWWGRWLLKLARQPLPDETGAAIPEPQHDDAPEAQEGGMGMTDTVTKIAYWLINGQTGLSSKTMAEWLGLRTKPTEVNHPHDPADFNRCLLLLEAVPELRERLPDMAELSPAWKGLVEHWDEIERSFLDEVGRDWSKARRAPETYALMRRVLEACGGF